MKKVIIIGAGPAGLAAGCKLCEHKVNPLILEKDAGVGGLSRTINYKGYYFDVGPHRFFTKNEAVSRWWHDLLGDDLLKKSRYTRIYYNGKFFDYPVSIPNVLANLGLFNSFPIFSSYLKSRFFPHPEEECFEKWVTNRFGKRLYEIFFKSYTEKLWGIPCSQISAEWASQRIKGLSLSAALSNALFRGRGNTVKTLIREFHYPRKGSGMMYEAAAEKIIQKGGSLKLNCEVTQIRHDQKRITGLRCRDTSTGSFREIEGTDFCSSMPLDALIMQMNPRPREEIIKNCRRLTYRSLLLVYVIVRRSDLFKDNWIYVHSSDVLVGRIQNYKNWSTRMVPDLNTTSLGMEYFCTEGDPAWNQTDEEAIQTAAHELEILRIAGTGDIQDAFVIRVPRAYPVYEKKYREAISVIKDFVGSFANLQCIGRYGMFRYNNMDHSVLTGFLAAKNILGSNEDLWNVNTEQSYHEELEENNAVPL